MNLLNLQNTQPARLTLASLFLNLMFIGATFGYSIYILILSPFIGDYVKDSSVFTWTFRASVIIITGFAFFLTKTSFPKFNWKIGLFIIFYMMYLFRAIVDIELRSFMSFDQDLAWRLYMQPNFRLQAWAFILPLTLFPLIVIYKAWRQIDLQRILNWILVLGSISVLLALFFMSSSYISLVGADADERINATGMLNTISLGHFGATVAILCCYKILDKTYKNVFAKLLLVPIAIVGLIIMMRSGSRGPVFSLFVVAMFWFAAMSRYFIIGATLTSIIILCSYIFVEKILFIIEKISPILAARLEATVKYGESSGRDHLMDIYFDEILNKPFFGSQLDFFGYSHNAVVDGFVMFGMFFGWIVFALFAAGYISAFRIIKNRLPNYWVALISIQTMTMVQTSFFFGGNSQVQVPMLLVFIMSAFIGNYQASKNPVQLPQKIAA